MGATAFAADPHHAGGAAPHGGGGAPHAAAPHVGAAAPRMGGGVPHGGGGFAHGGGMASFSHAAPSHSAGERRGGFASSSHTAPSRGIEQHRTGVASFGHTTDVHRNTAASHSFERGMEAPRGAAATTVHGRRGAYGGMEHAGTAVRGNGQAARDARGFGTRPSNWNNRPHNFNRGTYQRNVTASQRFHYGSYNRPSGWVSRRWTYGEYLPTSFWARDYWLTSWWMFDLTIPPYGYEWVRYGDDALLVNVDTGQILQVQYDVFY